MSIRNYHYAIPAALSLDVKLGFSNVYAIFITLFSVSSPVLSKI